MNSTPAGAPLTSSTSATGIGPASAGAIPVASATTAIRIFIIASYGRNLFTSRTFVRGLTQASTSSGIEGVCRNKRGHGRPSGFDLIENAVAYTLRLLHPMAIRETRAARPDRDRVMSRGGTH